MIYHYIKRKNERFLRVILLFCSFSLIVGARARTGYELVRLLLQARAQRPAARRRRQRPRRARQRPGRVFLPRMLVLLLSVAARAVVAVQPVPAAAVRHVGEEQRLGHIGTFGPLGVREATAVVIYAVVGGGVRAPVGVVVVVGHRRRGLAAQRLQLRRLARALLGVLVHARGDHALAVLAGAQLEVFRAAALLRRRARRLAHIPALLRRRTVRVFFPLQVQAPWCCQAGGAFATFCCHAAARGAALDVVVRVFGRDKRAVALVVAFWFTFAHENAGPAAFHGCQFRGWALEIVVCGQAAAAVGVSAPGPAASS